MPYRLTGNQGTDLHCFINNLSYGVRNISALSLGMPVPLSTTFPFRELLKGPMDFMMPLTPDIGKHVKILTQSTVLRGIPNHLLSVDEYTKTAKQLSALFQYNSCLGNACPTFVAKTPCTLTHRYPNIFKPSVTQVGCVIENYARSEDTKVQRTSAMASLMNCEDIAKPLEVMLEGTTTANVAKFSGFWDTGIEQTDLESSREEMKSLVQNYQSGYHL